MLQLRLLPISPLPLPLRDTNTTQLQLQLVHKRLVLVKTLHVGDALFAFNGLCQDFYQFRSLSLD